MHRIDDIPQQVAAIEQCLVNACCVGKKGARFKKAAEMTTYHHNITCGVRL